MPQQSLTMRAPAKLNVGLHLLGKRSDGYHDIETIFLMTDCCDELEVRSTTSGLSLQCDHPAVPGDQSNLVLRAAQLLAAEARVRQGAQFTLRKCVPVAAGLGGGSSDAASTLLALNYVWDVRWPRSDLARLAATLGADVPFFLTAPCAIGTGTGATVQPLPLSRSWPVLLINPDFPVSTAWAYGQAKLPLTQAPSKIKIMSLYLQHGALDELRRIARNDLQALVVETFPEVGRIIDAARHCGAPWVFMSGSGPTVVAWFVTGEAARAAAEQLAERWSVRLQHTLVDLAEVYPEAALAAAPS